jgi:roadblock/LC7 domain-containing protein
MGEFDELISRDGVVVAGRFGPDWRVADHKTAFLFLEYQPAVEFMGWFCAAVQMMFGALALGANGLSPQSWQPVRGWTVSGGDYSIAMHGDRFMVVETEKVGSLDELRRLLLEEKP